MIEIKPRKTRDCQVEIPGSKSYTHRMLIAAAMSDGRCVISNPLKSRDTLLTASALRRLGVDVDPSGDKGEIVVPGGGGEFAECNSPIHLENSGTSMRLLTAIVSLGRGKYLLTGSRRMCERPLEDLIDALVMLNVPITSLNNNGCPPVEIVGGRVGGGRTEIKCGISSQYLSGLLLMAPYTESGLQIAVTQGPVSKPYIDMTVDVMERFGVSVERDGHEHFSVAGGQTYKAGRHTVPPDASQAGYFWGIAAINSGSVKVKNVTPDSHQGDVRFVEVLERMGCRASREPDGITVTGGNLSAVEADMAHMPDLVPTLAVIAAFAKGDTVIKNVPHLKAKECDRLFAVATELKKMGVNAEAFDDGIRIEGGRPSGAEIETYDDHRIAMSFAMAGLKVPGVKIRDEMCVEKSFPNFWEVLEGM